MAASKAALVAAADYVVVALTANAAAAAAVLVPCFKRSREASVRNICSKNSYNKSAVATVATKS